MTELLSDGGYYTCGIGKIHFVPEANELYGFHSRLTQEELPVRADKDDYIAMGDVKRLKLVEKSVMLIHDELKINVATK